MENENPNIKKVIFIIVSFIVFLILLEWVWHYFHSGRVIITTNNAQNKISLEAVDSKNVGGASTSIYKSSGNLSANVSLGRYAATVSNGQQSTTQLITLNSHKTLRYNLSLYNLQITQTVISTQAQDIAVNSSQLIYLNGSSGYLNEVNSSNSLSVVGSSNQFQTTKWANADYGVGQGVKQNLYLINNGSVSSLNVPFLTDTNRHVNYDIANNKQIYVSYGSSVYMGNQNNTFKKIYTAPSSSLVLGGSVNKVAVAYSTGNDDDQNNAGVTLAVVNSSGQVTKTTVGDDISNLVWSPNNQYLASLSESSVDIYNSSLHLISAIPTPFPTGYVSWINNNEFVYALNGKVWSYDLSTNRASILADLPLESSPSGLAVSADGSYVYVATDNTITNTNSAILRIGLNGQQASTIASQVQIILPMTLADCTISLVDFAQPPTILIEPTSEQSNLSQSYYIQEAQTELQQDGFNIGELGFSVSQVNQ